eukprot:6686838-Pyramimonas_sp.AAC.1
MVTAQLQSQCRNTVRACLRKLFGCVCAADPDGRAGFRVNITSHICVVLYIVLTSCAAMLWVLRRYTGMNMAGLPPSASVPDQCRHLYD